MNFSETREKTLHLATTTPLGVRRQREGFPASHLMIPSHRKTNSLSVSGADLADWRFAKSAEVYLQANR